MFNEVKKKRNGRNERKTNGQLKRKRLHQAEEKDFKNNRRGQRIFYIATVQFLKVYAYSLISKQCA